MFVPHDSPSPRLAAAIVLSTLLHAALLLAPTAPHRTTPVPLQVSLVPPSVPVAPSQDIHDAPQDSLLKNTLEARDAPPPPRAPTPPQPPQRKATGPTPEAQALTQTVAAARRKLSTLLFYPEPARAAGLEGEVHLRLTLDPAGRIEAADVAISSGHALLDRAALQAAYAMAQVEAGGRRELLLPVIFRLR